MSVVCHSITHMCHYLCSVIIMLGHLYMLTNLHIVYEAFEQWKKLLWLLCSCEEAIAIHHDLYTSFIGEMMFYSFYDNYEWH